MIDQTGLIIPVRVIRDRSESLVREDLRMVSTKLVKMSERSVAKERETRWEFLLINSKFYEMQERTLLVGI